jgi:1,4-alpha-glucan branching enzyme
VQSRDNHPSSRYLILTFGFLFFAASVVAQSSRPGMGAIPYSNLAGTGVTFRVWAPNATSVSVPGTFNAWSTNANLLVKESGSDLWSADVPTARPYDQYKYFINGSVWKRDPRGRWVTTSTGNTIVYDPNAFAWAGDSRLAVNASNLVIYEMHIGGFYDPTPSSGGPGKFSDAITKLDYLAKLGVNAVELMPIWEFPGDYSWGYNPTDPYAVENSGYGGPDGLKAFVKAAHQRGIRVLLDVVHNHYGPSDLDLWGFDNGTTPGIYFYSASGICCSPWGSRPSYSSEGVRSYIIDNIRMWLDECHVDGFRWDAVGAMRHYDPGYISIPEADSLIQYINSTIIHAQHPGAITIAEDDSSGMDFDAQWAVGSGDEFINEMVQPFDGSRDMNNLQSAMNGNGFSRVIYDETHDLVGDLNGSGAQRLPVRIHSADPTSYYARKRSMLAAAIVLTIPGIPMLFMGQEMLATNQFSASVPLDWSRVTNYSSVVSFYRDLIRLRRNLDGASWGLTGPNISWHAVDNTSKVLAYHRWGAGPDDQVMVVINCSNTQFNNYQINGWPADGTWFVNLNSDWPIYGADFGNTGTAEVQVSGGIGSVAIGPYSVLILSRTALPSLQFSDIHATGTNMVMSWKGGPTARQIVQQATNLNGPWISIYTNQPPTAVSNSIALPISTGVAKFFRIQLAP